MAAVESISINITASTENAVSKIERLNSALAKVRSMFQDIQSASKIGVEVGENTVSRINALAASLRSVNSVVNNLSKKSLASVFDIPSNVPGKIRKIADSLSEAKSVLDGFKFDFRFSVPKDAGTRLSNLAEAVKKTKKSLRGFESKIKVSVSVPADASSRLMELSRTIHQINTEMPDVNGFSISVDVPAGSISNLHAMSSAASIITSWVDKLVLSVVRLYAGLAGNVLAKSLAAAIYPAKSLYGHMTGIWRSVSGLLRSLRRVALYRVFRTIIKAFTQGLKEGMNNLYKYSEIVGTQFAKSMDSLATSALYMKNSLATIAEPLINKLAPAIDHIADKFADMAAHIAEFFAALAGETTYTRALKFPKKYGEEAEKTAKALNKWLGPFDEINRLSSPASGGTGEDLDYEKMFETVEVESEGYVSKFVTALREAWESGDFSTVGATIAQKLKDQLDGIDWESIKEKAAKLGSSIGTGITGFFTGEGFASSIGSSIAEALNTAITFAASLKEGLDFAEIGRSFGEGLKTFLETFEFSTFVGTVVGFGTGFVTFLAEAIKTVEDWKEVGEKIGDAIRDINWNEAFGAVLDLGSTIMKALFEIVIGVTSDGSLSAMFESLGEEVGKALADEDLWKKAFQAATGLGGAIIQGLLAAVSGAASSMTGTDIDLTVSKETGEDIFKALVGVWGIKKIFSLIFGGGGGGSSGSGSGSGSGIGGGILSTILSLFGHRQGGGGGSTGSTLLPLIGSGVALYLMGDLLVDGFEGIKEWLEEGVPFEYSERSRGSVDETGKPVNKREQAEEILFTRIKMPDEFVSPIETGRTITPEQAERLKKQREPLNDFDVPKYEYKSFFPTKDIPKYEYKSFFPTKDIEKSTKGVQKYRKAVEELEQATDIFVRKDGTEDKFRGIGVAAERLLEVPLAKEIVTWKTTLSGSLVKSVQTSTRAITGSAKSITAEVASIGTGVKEVKRVMQSGDPLGSSGFDTSARAIRQSALGVTPEIAAIGTDTKAIARYLGGKNPIGESGFTAATSAIRGSARAAGADIAAIKTAAEDTKKRLSGKNPLGEDGFDEAAEKIRGSARATAPEIAGIDTATDEVKKRLKGKSPLGEDGFESAADVIRGSARDIVPEIEGVTSATDDLKKKLKGKNPLGEDKFKAASDIIRGSARDVAPDIGGIGSAADDLKKKLKWKNPLGENGFVSAIDSIRGSARAAVPEIEGIKTSIDGVKNKNKAKNPLGEDNFKAAANTIKNSAKSITPEIAAIDTKLKTTKASVKPVSDAFSSMGRTLKNSARSIGLDMDSMVSAVDGFKTDALESMDGFGSGLENGMDATMEAFVTSGKGGLATMLRNYQKFGTETARLMENLGASFDPSGLESYQRGGGGGGPQKPFTESLMYANGGFVDTGEAFIARESGPEFVGRIGSRTAVANNDQIVKGVATGVEEANEGVITAVYAIAGQIIGAIKENRSNGGVDWDAVSRKISITQARQAASAFN